MKCEKNQFNCPVEATLSLIGGKYKPLILWHLIDHPLHYMELQRLIPNATPKMLSQQLHDLENNGMIHREVIPEKPPKTVYSLTPFGQSIVSRRSTGVRRSSRFCFPQPNRLIHERPQYQSGD